jgi:hypothetical protein
MNGFIENIFAYCDRWCERCAFTSRCRGFVNNENLPVTELLKTDEKNRQFWENVNAFLPEATTFVKETAQKNNLDLTTFDNIPKQVKFDLFQRKAISNNVLKSGRQYEDMVDDWLDNQMENNCIVAVETRLGGAYKIVSSVISNEEQNFVNDMISVIVRYQLQLYLKISRAYYSKGISAEQNDSNKEAATDANGTVKAVLEMIDRSLSAWYVCNTKIHNGSDEDIFQIMVLLTRIKNNLLSDFPESHKFIRPGFDE